MERENTFAVRCSSAPRKTSKSEWLVQLIGGANCHLDSCTRGSHQSGDGAAAGGSEPAKLTATGRRAGRRKRPAVDFAQRTSVTIHAGCHDGYRVRADRRSDFTWPKSTLGGESVPPGGRDSHTNLSPPERAAISVIVTANPPVAERRPRVAGVAIIAVGAVSEA